jgi:hypothetical protein
VDLLSPQWVVTVVIRLVFVVIVEVEDEVKLGGDSQQTVSTWEKLLPMPRSTYKKVQVNVWEKMNLLTSTGDLMGDGCRTGETQYWGQRSINNQD